MHNQLLLLTGESRRFALRFPAGEHVVFFRRDVSGPIPTKRGGPHEESP